MSVGRQSVVQTSPRLLSGRDLYCQFKECNPRPLSLYSQLPLLFFGVVWHLSSPSLFLFLTSSCCPSPSCFSSSCISLLFQGFHNLLHPLSSSVALELPISSSVALELDDDEHDDSEEDVDAVDTDSRSDGGDGLQACNLRCLSGFAAFLAFLSSPCASLSQPATLHFNLPPSTFSQMGIPYLFLVCRTLERTSFFCARCGSHQHD